MFTLEQLLDRARKDARDKAEIEMRRAETSAALGHSFVTTKFDDSQKKLLIEQAEQKAVQRLWNHLLNIAVGEPPPH